MNERLIHAARAAIFALLCIGSEAVCRNVLQFHGPIPVTIDEEEIESAYRRIWDDVSPGVPCDTAPIYVFYLKRSEKQWLGSRLPEWGGGGAIGRDTVVVATDRQPLLNLDLQKITVHELVHIALARAYGWIRIPRWFHEGLAMALSGELSFEAHTVVSRAIFTGNLLALDTIERVNLLGPYHAQLAYAQSHLAMLFLIETYGLDGVPELLEIARRTRSFDTALYQILGLSSSELERMVDAHISKRYRYVFLAADTWIYWIGLIVLASAGYVITRIRNRRRLAEMDREETLSENRGEGVNFTGEDQSESNGEG